MSHPERHHAHDRDRAHPAPAAPAHDPEPRERHHRGARPGGQRVEPQHGGSGFHDAFASAHGHHRSIVGATVGHARTGTRDQVLIAQREVSPAAGFPDRGAATAFAAARPGTLLAIVHLPDDTFHVFDTGYTPPRPTGAPGSARTEPRVQVSAVSRAGMYDVVDWANLELLPHDPLPDGAPEPTMRGTGPDGFGRFSAHNAALGQARLTQIRLALDSVLGSDVELAAAFYDNYTRNRLRVADGDTLERLRRNGEDAITGATGNTDVLPEVFDRAPALLASVLLHEAMHARRDEPVAHALQDEPEREGDGYAMQYFILERAGGPQAERDRILRIVVTGSGVMMAGNSRPLTLRFNRTYVALVVLQQLIDGRFTHADAPFARMSPGRAGELMHELATEHAASSELQQVIDWADANRSRFTLPRVRI